MIHNDEKPSLLLHVCCAPCGTHPIRLLRDTFNVTAFFCNPNIHPKSEHDTRVEEIHRLARSWGFPLLFNKDDIQEWFQLIKGHESDPEGGKRCDICYRMRLQKTAETAVQNGMTRFTTTLSISPHKSAEKLNRIGNEVAKQFHLQFVEANFKKQNGFKISCDLSREEHLYRQNYCGCVYSRREMKQRQNR